MAPNTSFSCRCTQTRRNALERARVIKEYFQALQEKVCHIQKETFSNRKKKKKVIYNIRDTKLRSFKVTLKIYLVHFLASDHRQLLEKSQYYLNLPYLKVFSSYSELSHREVVEVMRHSRWRKKTKHHKQKRKKSKQQKWVRFQCYQYIYYFQTLPSLSVSVSTRSDLLLWTTGSASVWEHLFFILITILTAFI